MLQMNTACGFCRQRKVKCSKGLPKCSGCLKLNKEYAYTPRQRPISLTMEYVEQLQRRIIYLERAIYELSSKQRIDDLQTLGNYDVENINSIYKRDIQLSQENPSIDIRPDFHNYEINEYLKLEDFLLSEDFYKE